MSKRPTGLLLLFCTLVALVAGGLAPAHADSSFATLKSLIESGRYDEARAFSAHVSSDPATNQLNLDFTNALILKVQRHYAEAAAAMRAILSSHPNLTRVRAELADTLYLMGDMDAATFNFQLLANSTSDTTQRGFYDSYLTAIRTKRPWTLDAYVAIAPSTNINNGVAGDTVDIGGAEFDSGANKGRSGVGAAYGIAGTYRFDLAPMWALTFGGKASGTAYIESSFDQLNGSAFTELAYATPQWRVGVGITGDRMTMGWQGYNWDVGPQLSVSRNFGAAGTVIATAGWKHVAYDSATGLNGNETDLGMRYLKTVNASASYGLGFLYSDVTADVSSNAYNRYRPSVELYKELRGGLLTSLTLGYEWRDYKANFFLLGTPRADRELDLDLAVTFRNFSWHGFAPKIDYTFTHNDSNVALYAYNSQAIGLYLTKQY